MGAVAHHRETQPLLTCVPSGCELGIQICSTPFVLPSFQSPASTRETRGQENSLMGLEEQMKDAQLNG